MLKHTCCSFEKLFWTSGCHRAEFALYSFHTDSCFFCCKYLADVVTVFLLNTYNKGTSPVAESGSPTMFLRVNQQGFVPPKNGQFFFAPKALETKWVHYSREALNTIIIEEIISDLLNVFPTHETTVARHANDTPQ